MNKLIDYNGLSTFHTNLLDDNNISPKSTWSSEKINTSKQNRLTAGQNISIDASNNISADGYVFDRTYAAFATIYNDYWGGSGSSLVANVATGNGAHAEGAETSASSDYAHAEGWQTTASNDGAHAEGVSTIASGSCAHAEGNNTIASGFFAHAEGWHTTAQNRSEHTEGQFNKSHQANDTFGNAGNTLHSIGIGYLETTHQLPIRSNAVEVMQNGDMYVFGVGGYQGTDTKVQNASILTLQEYIVSLEARITALERNTPVS